MQILGLIGLVMILSVIGFIMWLAFKYCKFVETPNQMLVKVYSTW